MLYCVVCTTSQPIYPISHILLYTSEVYTMNKIIAVCPVTTHKRVTLPQKVMEQLNIESRESSVIFMEVDGKIVITKAEVR